MKTVSFILGIVVGLFAYAILYIIIDNIYGNEPQTRDEQIILLHKEGFTQRQIADMVGVHQKTVWRVLKKAEEKK